jgi:hypothetical protein
MYVVKKKRIINKLSKKINQIASGPAKKDFIKVYESHTDVANRPITELDIHDSGSKQSLLQELLGKGKSPPRLNPMMHQEVLKDLYGIHIPAQGLKEERVHFNASSQIDLTFPDIKQHVFIESSRNSAGVSDGKTSKYHTIKLNRNSFHFKPPLPGGALPTGGPSQRYKNESKPQNQIPDPSTVQQFKGNMKLRQKYEVQNNLSTIFADPEFDKTKVLRKFENEQTQLVHDKELARNMVKSTSESG